MRHSLLAAAILALGTPALADNVFEFAAHSEQHRTFAATMQSTGIDRALSNPGPYTIFAPTDAAFSAMPRSYLRPEHREELVQLLTCHMAPTVALVATLRPGETRVIRTVGGCNLTLQRSGDTIVLRDAEGHSHRIAASDLQQSNGVVHVVDSLIVPKS